MLYLKPKNFSNISQNNMIIKNSVSLEEKNTWWQSQEGNSFHVCQLMIIHRERFLLKNYMFWK